MANVDIGGDDVGAQDIPINSPGDPDPDPQARPNAAPPPPAPPPPPPAAEVEIEREFTKRKLIESVTQIIVMVLYMIFTLLREREAGVVVIDPDNDGPDGDWKE